MTAENPRAALEGPPAWANWRIALEGAPAIAAAEVQLYTDARITGDVSSGLGPYQFLNPVDDRYARGYVRPALTLRISFHSPPDDEPSPYYGGSIAHELSALASLLTGIRFRAAGETRYFDPQGDPRGRPTARHFIADPVLPMGISGWVLPHCGGTQSLSPLQKLARYPSLRSEDAVAVVRAARIYRDALWVAEIEPNLAWIMLVSAIEAAAHRYSSEEQSPLEILRAGRAELYQYLAESASPAVGLRVAREIAHSLRATKKFLDFLSAHAPPPPHPRPATSTQVAWTRKNLRRAFSSIYSHRSEALHSGIPFPAPLCEPVVYRNGPKRVPAERPVHEQGSPPGAASSPHDMPMYLHTFEYVARQAIGRWFTELPDDQTRA